MTTRFFVRRLPNEISFLRTHRVYEVGICPQGVTEPVDIQRTRRPESVLLKAGEHTTDIWDYMHNADSAWTGGVGPWRGIFPYETPDAA